MTEGSDPPSPFGYEHDKPGTNARTEAEADIEEIRQQGGPFVEAVARTRMPMAVTDFRLPGNPIVFANDAFLRLSGYAVGEVLGQKPHFMNGPNTDPDDAARFREALRRGEDIVVDSWQYRKDKTPFYATVFVSPIADDQGHVVQHFLSYLDITRRVEAEQQVRAHAAELQEQVARRTRALTESEARLAAAFESVPVGIAAIDLAGKIIIANAEYRRFLPMGIVPSRDPERGGRWQAWDDAGQPVAPEDFPSARALRGESAAGGLTMLYTDDDGREIWTEVASVPTFGEAGQVSGAVTTISDIDQRKRGADALRESEAKYRTLFAGMAEGFCIFDMIFDEAGKAVDYRFVEVNPAFEVHTGLADANGKTIRELAPDHEAYWFEAYGRVSKTGQPVSLVLRGEALGNRWFEVHAFRLGDPEQGRVAAIFQDITERKVGEEHQRMLLAELQHRVRNTLGIVRSIARRTAQNSRSVEELSAHLDGRLEAFARVQAAVARNPTSGVDLRGLIEDELVAHALREGEAVTLEGPEVTLAVRPAETLSLAFHELVTNAVKYGALGVQHGRIAIHWLLADGRLEFTWRESGAPPAGESEREGFGFELLRRVIPYELSARTEVEFGADGLAFSLSMPIEGNIRLLESQE